MFQNHQQFNTAQLNVPYDGVDQSTMNPNLPQGNDRTPQVQISQWMAANQQIGLFAIGLFRSMAQSAYSKSPTHVAGYNLLSQGHFNNQVWNQYGQMVLDLTEFLILVKGYNPNEAVQKAAQRVYEAFLGMVYYTYGVLQQVTPTSIVAGLQTAMQIHQQVVNDIKMYRSGGYNQPQQNQFAVGGVTQLPQINLNQHQQYHSSPQHGINQFQTSGHASTYSQPQMHNTASGPTNSVDSAFYDDPAPVQPLRPVEEVSTETLDYYGNAFSQEPKPMNTFNTQTPAANQFVEPEVTDLPVPTNVNQVVVDATYYAPSGFKMDLKRPYDVVWNPGGIEIRPAQLVDWEITVGDDMPWQQLADPARFCLFYVKFPDGVIKEKFVEWNPSMEYLRHELDAEMRRKAYRPNGIVVAASTPISTVGGDAITESDAFTLIQDGHLKRSATPPIILSAAFSGATDLEVEMSVREELQNLLTIEFSPDVPMPAAEYRSTFLHPINISEECFNKLVVLSKQEELTQVALGLRELTTQGILPIRYYRFINDRFTKAVNDVLRDGLSMTVDITDFCEDYPDLPDYIIRKKGEAMATVLQGTATSVINKAMYLMETTDGSEDQSGTAYHVADNYINVQLGWSLDDLATPSIRNGKATLISASSHPTLLESLRGMIGRAYKNEEFIAGTMRVITSDGYYLEVIKGLLIKSATLLKLVK